jgi:hypothetical protein
LGIRWFQLGKLQRGGSLLLLLLLLLSSLALLSLALPTLPDVQLYLALAHFLLLHQRLLFKRDCPRFLPPTLPPCLL